MRKITLYLSLLLTFLGVTANEALAQISCVDLSSMNVGESKTVIMHVGGTNVNKFIGTFSNQGSEYYNDGKDNLNGTLSEYYYTITKEGNNTISIKDSHDKYVPGFTPSTTANGGAFRNNQSSAKTFTFAEVISPANPLNAAGNAYTLTYTETNGYSLQYITGSNRLGVKTGTDITFQFVESSNVKTVAISCTDTNNGQYNFSYTVNALVGQSINDVYVTPALSSAEGTYESMTYTPAGNITAETTAINIELTSTYTFPVKMNTPYFLQCRYLTGGFGDKSNSFPFFMQRLGSNSTSTVAENKTFDLNQIWYFERVTTSPNEVVVRNMGSKTGETYNGITGTGGAPTYSATPTAYVLANHNASTDAFSLHVAGTNSYLGGHIAGTPVSVNGKSVNSRLSVWTDGGAAGDNGSAFNAIEVTWSDLAAGIPYIQQAAEAATNLTRYVSSEYATTISTKTEDVTIENIASAFDNASYTFTLNTDKYYLLYSAKSGFNNYYAYANPRADKEGTPIDDNRKFYLNTNASIPQALLKFEAVEGASTYYIEHVNSGLFVSQTSKNAVSDLPLDKQWADKFSLETDNDDKTIWSIKGNTKNVYLNFFSGWADKPLGGWDQNSTSDGGSGFRIVRVDEIPVTLSSAGWSTMTLPVAVTIPSGVHAYYITRNEGTVVYVEEITGVIPAKTPVLLNGTASTTYRFPITTTLEAAPTNNKLLGTTMARKGFSTDDTGTPDVYGLYVNETTASFVPAFSDVVPANKAVLPYANIDLTGIPSSEEALALSLSFEDITGISFVNASQSKGDIFDLQGRRVLYPVRGQVYIQNGQKFILK